MIANAERNMGLARGYSVDSSYYGSKQREITAGEMKLPGIAPLFDRILGS